MKLHIVSSTKERTISGEVAWKDGTNIALGTKSTETFVDHLLQATHPKVGLLPPAVRWMSNDKRVIVFERPPAYQRIAYFEHEREALGSGIREDQALQYVLPMPWLVYVMGFGHDYQPITIRTYMRGVPLENLDDFVYLLPLLNFYTTSKLCNPIFGKFEEHEATISAGIHVAYNTVWNSGFNFDLVDAVKYGVNHNSPFPSKMTNTKFGSGWSGQIRNFFRVWSEHNIGDMLDTAKFISPSHENNGAPETITLRDAIQAVHDELFLNMGSGNLSKNFVTALVNNFSSI